VSIYIGLIAVVLNLVVVVGITAVLTVLRISPNLDRTRPEDYTGDADREGLD
jgi:solute:Na+ symporter, SSS family